METVIGRAEKLSGRARRTTPERKPAAGDSSVEGGADRETVVAVVLVIFEQRSDLVPHRAPRRTTGKPQTRREAGRVAERKIEPGQYALAAPHRIFQQFPQQYFRRTPGRRVLEQRLRPVAGDSAN